MACNSKKATFEELIETMSLAEVEKILELANNVEKTLHDKEASKLLRRYMESKVSTKKISLQCLDIHEKCAEFLAEKHPLYDSFELDILARLGLAPHLKQNLAYRLNNGDPLCISLCLKNIQVACRGEIEDFFSDYKDSIIKKLTSLKLESPVKL
ncbi:uncharacterized protein LOC108116185 [Drosophila eugracilis]|uniref:uncharacterized protein LOC108116185 n=1 Tax=Drosophila eugracilis TaxID=29029 RepID=UPI001BDAC63B|nr:uncharacterized protein LOC108116185 [Drosophila eugracilis]